MSLASGVLTRRRALAVFLALPLGCRREPSRQLSEHRVVSLSPSTTEAVFAIGAGDELVGRSTYCDHPPEAASLPAVGGFADPSLEAILALRPSVVVGARGPAGPALEETLAAQGVPTYFPQTESIAEIEAMLAGLGERLGKANGAAAVVARLRDEIRAVRERVEGRPRPRAVWMFDFTAVIAAGPGGFPDELLKLAGGENLVRDGSAYPQLSIERLLSLDPEVLIDGTGDGSESAAARARALREQPGYRELRAVREGRVLALASSTALRPGPRIGQGLVELASLLHPARGVAP